MIVFGVGASTCATECEKLAFSRLTEVTDTTVPAGATTGAADAAGRIRVFCQAACFSVPHSNSVPSVQMQCRMTAILRATATLAFLAPNASPAACPTLSGPTSAGFGAAARSLPRTGRFAVL